MGAQNEDKLPQVTTPKPGLQLLILRDSDSNLNLSMINI